MAVPYQVTEKLQQDLKNMGTDVTFLLVDDQNHTGAIVAKNAELVAFDKACQSQNNLLMIKCSY
jgi:hypothetical protein